jgi:hypothetical protein
MSCVLVAGKRCDEGRRPATPTSSLARCGLMSGRTTCRCVEPPAARHSALVRGNPLCWEPEAQQESEREKTDGYSSRAECRLLGGGDGSANEDSPGRFCVSCVLGTPIEARKLSNLRLTFETRLLGARIFPRSAADAVDFELRSGSDLFQIRVIPESRRAVVLYLSWHAQYWYLCSQRQLEVWRDGTRSCTCLNYH